MHMNNKEKIFSLLVSVVIALVTLWFIEERRYADGVRQYFFGTGNSIGQYAIFATNYYEGLKLIMLLLFAFFVVYVSFFVILFEAIALTYFLFTSKWSKPKVFISYKNPEAGSTIPTGAIAADIKTVLEQKGFKVLFFQYTLQMDHDSINSNSGSSA